MLESFFVSFLVASVLGILAGLGLGGGSLLILYVTAIIGMDPVTARGLNLLFFLPTSLISTLLRIRSRSLPIKKVMPAVVAGTVCAVLFSYISNRMDMELLRRLFGGLLILTGLRELFYRPRNIK